MKIKVWQLEYDFDKEDAKIVVPLILLVFGLSLTPLRKDWLIGGAAAYYLLYFFLSPIFVAVKQLQVRARHWFRFRCPYCKSREIILQGMQEFHGDIPYDHYFCNRCRETSVYVNTAGIEKMIAPTPSKLKRSQRTLTP
jgi:DNA-directed RNA polymerase subunit M/transcription elongation factor TFIIS